MYKKHIKFPQNFLWGAGISAEQSEGYKGKKSNTIYKEQFEKNPEDFIDQIGPDITSNVFEKYKEDIDLYHKLNFNSFRTSISWARLFPDGMDNSPSQEAIKFYHNYIDACKEKNIDFILTLFHFDLPYFEYLKGGWESAEVIEDFIKYVDFVFSEYGHKINRFVTFCEPFIPAINGYINGRHFPKVKSLKRGISVAFSIILAHARVVKLFNNKYRKNNQIGCIFDAKKAYPLSNKQKDIDAAKISNFLFYEGMIDAMILGKFSDELKSFLNKNDLIPKMASSNNLNLIEEFKLDFYGLNFYAPHRIKATNKNNIFNGFFEKYVPLNARMNVFREIEISPETLYELIMDLNTKYKLPMFIAENGMGVENEHVFKKNKIIQDDYRIAFIKEHLYQIHRAIKKGVNVFGYHVWASIDNWSWINAYKNRYGLIEVDLKNQNRIIKKSGWWFKSVILNNGFSLPFKKIEETIDYSNLKFRKNN